MNDSGKGDRVVTKGGFKFKRMTTRTSDQKDIGELKSSSDTIATSASFPSKSLGCLIQQKESQHQQLERHQTSIKSFVQKRPKPVATVAPQRSPVKNESIGNLKRKRDDPNSSLFVSLLDDEDMEDFVLTSSQFTTAKKNVGLDSSKKEKNEVDRFVNDRSIVQTDVQVKSHINDPDPSELMDLFGQSDTDEENNMVFVPKRRRTNQILSDDEAEEDKNMRVARGSDDQNVVTNCKSTAKTSMVANSVGRPENNSLSSNEPISEDVEELRTNLLQTMDEICDIICQVSTSDLMSMVWQNYQRLQHLLAMRKTIKDKVNGLSPLTKPQSKQNRPSNTSSSTHSAYRNKMPLINNDLKHASPMLPRKLNPPSNVSSPIIINSQTSTPVSVEGSSKSFNFKRSGSTTDVSVGGFNSPIPCGESFFEDDAKLTQSHVSFMSSFNRRSLESPNNFNSTVSSPNPPPILNLDRSTSKLFSQTPHSSNKSNYDISNIQSRSPEFTNSPKVNRSVTRTSASVYSSTVGPDVCDDVECEDDLIDQVTDNMFDLDDDDFTEELTDEMLASDNMMPALKHTPRRSGEKKFGYSPNSAEKAKKKQAEENKEFDGYNFSHSRELVKIFHKVFGLREFRTNQLKAINAALLGNDCFILMPTGGGKSLCYQLTALVTGGVSIIVSPLRALIQDQVTRLNSMDIPAAQLSSDIDQNQADFIYRKMYYKTPEITLLYVTPEKISASTKLNSCLDNLYRRQLLSRFVIDEAHCVSQWGHDFRPDYKKLHVLKQKYPSVPMMALTATANKRVRMDIIHQLGMKNPKSFVQSFNRPNLKFSVEPKKPSTIMPDITKLIKERFPNKCGIVYCLSRNECDTTARELSKAGIQAVSYHAGLSDGERVSIQEKWLNGNRCKVICATIAFGMGIDKSDVRFVIHYSLPKSMEGYYQEAGRAGRDGILAHCLLYYTYQDVKRLRRIIEMDQNANYESKRVHIDNLFSMVQYCENVADCRRSQLLTYFGEMDFNREDCSQFKGSVCDNCVSKESFQLRDVTDDVKEIIKCVKDITMTGRRGNNFTLIHFVELFKGSKTSKITDLGHDRFSLYGRGKNYSRHDAERLFRKLVIEGILHEDLQITAAEHTACYIKLGRKANDVMMGNRKIELQVQASRKRTEVAKIGKEPVSKRENIIEECYSELVEMAKEIAREHNVRNFVTVFFTSTLRQMAQRTPVTVEEMKDKIDGLPEAKIQKYGADRFLTITTKYKEMLSGVEEPALQAEFADDGVPEWESPYFVDESSIQQKGKRGNRFRKNAFRGKKRGSTKKAGNSKSSGFSGSNTSTNLSAYKYKAKGRGFKKFNSSQSGGSNSGSARGGNSSRGGRGGNSLGFMPVPQPKRSFLSSAAAGTFFG